MDKDHIQYDILKELFNISIGKAADMLSEIVDRKILLDVPVVKLWYDSSEDVEVKSYLPQKIAGTLMVSSISFKEDLNGQANLIFSASKMKKFINLCMKEELGDSKSQDFTDVDFDIIKEIGNIILNCVLGEIGNFLNIKLNYCIPEVKVFNRIDLDKDVMDSGYSHVLVLHITFIIDDTEIEGAIIIDLTINSLQELTSRLDGLEADLDV